jgi:ABC-2 type transport system permease protein
MPIFDQGYQHWQGPLSGHAMRWLTIARQGTRVQTKGRRIRACILMAWLPALGLVIFMALWGLIEKKSESLLAFVKNILPPDMLLDPRAYRTSVWTLAFSFFFRIEMFFIMLLIAVAGPGLISGDLRFNALPLYLSRPMNRFDYFLGKLGVIGALVASVAVVPAVFAYIVGLTFSFDANVIKDTWPVLLASVGYGLVVTVSAGTLILAMSSLTRRSLYVGIAWAGFWIISGSVGTLLTEIHRESVTRGLYADEMERWVAANPPPAGVQVPRGNGAPRGKMRPPPRFKGGRIIVGADDRWTDSWWEASRRAAVKAQEDTAGEMRKNWRPLCSYVGNLERIADALLDTDAAWVTIGKAVVRSQQAVEAFGGPGGGGDGPARDDRFLADQMVPQYPAEWSAGVLVGLLGLSSWTLTRRVRSLDRLK